MAKQIVVCLVMFLCCGALTSRAEGVPVKARIESVAMFKNGLAMVRQVLSVDKSGEYIVENLARDPVHGTFWVVSDAPVKARATYQELDTDRLNPERLNLQYGFAGQEVEIHFKEPGQVPLKGVIEPMESKQQWNQDYQPPAYYYDYYYRNYSAGQPVPAPGLNLIVRTADGLALVDSSTIAFLKILSAKTSVKTRRPVVILSVGEMKLSPATIEVSYLAKGLSWAAAYRIDLMDNAKLVIEQSGVIKNEFGDIDGAETSLITGFPQVKFAHVTSPLSLRTNLSQFFAQLNQPPRSATGLAANLQQQAISLNEPAAVSGLDLAAAPKGEGVDLYYRLVGKTSLKEGEALFLSLARAEAPYERIVEWIVPDTRSPDGRPVQEYERQQNPDKYQDAAWDAISFKNSFGFPMTTGTASIYAQGKFNGQSQSNWVNPGETNVVYITKALSLRTAFSEQEEPGERTPVRLGGSSFQKVTVAGELSVKNNRAQAVNARIRRQFSGELLNASDAPEVTLREEGVYSVNRRNELKWDVVLPPGEEKKLTYTYTVFTPY